LRPEEFSDKEWFLFYPDSFSETFYLKTVRPNKAFWKQALCGSIISFMDSILYFRAVEVY